MSKILVFIPTYEEVENVAAMCEQIMALPLQLDLYFINDGSSDGTGEELDRLATLYSRITVRHRSGKLGIGSAHREGIAYAYGNGYDLLVTMDCDFTHDPAKIPDLLARAEEFPVVLGSRFLHQHSLPGWSLFRKSLTRLGHFLTRNLLLMRYDATGAFRAYDLRKIPPRLFEAIRSRSYSFFFESLFVLINGGMEVTEIPIALPARTYGHSKLSFFEAYRSALFLLKLALERWINPGRFRAGRAVDKLRADLHDPQDWAPYWQQKKQVSGFVYEFVAAIYRRTVLRPALKRSLSCTFSENSRLLHAGCGSGQVDAGLHRHFQIVAVDISGDAVDLYSRYNPDASWIEQASILDLPFEDESYDGIYNLGVLEHFTEEEVVKILRQFHRVLRASGKIVIFWPHRYASSVLFLKSIRWAARVWGGKEIQFHPKEILLLQSKAQAESIFSQGGFTLASYHMDFRDGFIQAVLVGQK